jgi:hypothetical protein
MGKVAEDRTGQRFGRLLVIGRGTLRYAKHACWTCKCDCGKEITSTSQGLISGRYVSCGCSRKEKMKLGLNLQHGQTGTHKWIMLQGAKARAKKKSLPFSITLEDIPEIPERCPILGIPLKRRIGRGHSDNSPSLDRIIPEKGYVPNNIQIISQRANEIKSDATPLELMKVATYIKKLHENK